MTGIFDTTKALWLDRFTVVASQLLPSSTCQEIWEYAELIFDEAGDLEPAAAAEAFALALPPWQVKFLGS